MGDCPIRVARDRSDAEADDKVNWIKYVFIADLIARFPCLTVVLRSLV